MLKICVVIILMTTFLLAFAGSTFSEPSPVHPWQDEKNLDNESSDPAPEEDGSGDSLIDTMLVLSACLFYLLEYVIT